MKRLTETWNFTSGWIRNRNGLKAGIYVLNQTNRNEKNKWNIQKLDPPSTVIVAQLLSKDVLTYIAARIVPGDNSSPFPPQPEVKFQKFGMLNCGARKATSFLFSISILWPRRYKVAECSFCAGSCWCDIASAQALQKDKHKHAVNRAIILYDQRPHFLYYFSS